MDMLRTIWEDVINKDMDFMGESSNWKGKET